MTAKPTSCLALGIHPEGNHLMKVDFEYDAILSYCSHDRAKVGGVVSRLRENGLRVWFNQSGVQQGDDTFSRVQDGGNS